MRIEKAMCSAMKAIREREGVGEAKIDRPTVIDEICALAAFKPHSAVVL